MKEVQITSADIDRVDLQQLYQTAFPEEEQIPWKELMRMVDEMPLDFTAYYEGDDFVGFTIVYPRKTFNWFWYFAVREELRGRGIGQQILTNLWSGIRASQPSWIWSRPTIRARTQSSASVGMVSTCVTASVTPTSIGRSTIMSSLY